MLNFAIQSQVYATPLILRDETIELVTRLITNSCFNNILVNIATLDVKENISLDIDLININLQVIN